MRRNKQDNPAELGQSDPGDMWHALARLHASHPDPVGRLVPFERPAALLSLTEPDDFLFTARVELSGAERMGHLHDLIRTVTHGITTELGYVGPGVALEVLVGKRHAPRRRCHQECCPGKGARVASAMRHPFGCGKVPVRRAGKRLGACPPS
ncbi:hypothetical protein OG765_37610 [Streptomyces sp. NBC_00555]|uniref:hypothetical protein n=1 Tax=Streptomyces sp. NBC_00555 TaxID=2903662 RepID=UPI002251BD5B|nr:hypothetical protein [Streptomyces sp. NBC_00555]MCX5016642.1 hypothetical protein [Streptomyces sp. NBC_00555]